MMAAALAYAERGWPVFPCSPSSRAPLLACDKDGDGRSIHNTGGVRKASTDLAAIRDWWTRWPRAMIAAATGHPTGFFVVDVDVKTVDGRAEMAVLEDKHGYLPETWQASTPSGGLHLYFHQPVTAITNRVGFVPGCDVRTTGGSITLPPSRRADGRGYAWQTSPDEIELARPPAWLLAMIRPAVQPLRFAPTKPVSDRYAAAALRNECADIASMKPNTGRNQRLFQGAAKLGELVASGALDRRTVEAELTAAAYSCGLQTDDGGAHGIAATINSGLTRGLQRPRGAKSDVSPIMRRTIKGQHA